MTFVALSIVRMRVRVYSMESESETVASSAASFSADAFHGTITDSLSATLHTRLLSRLTMQVFSLLAEHLTKNAARPHPILGQPTFNDTFGGSNLSMYNFVGLTCSCVRLLHSLLHSLVIARTHK